MPEETLAPPAAATATAPPRLHTRVRHGMRRPHNWIQLAKFFLVGGSGYLVNLVTYWAIHNQLGVGHLRSATAAFVVAVFNNFWWNRHWTFGAREGHAGFQAARFFAVSVGVFFFALAISQVLVAYTSIPDIVAQAISIVVATPLNFVGNKMWSFSHRPSRASGSL
jgi:dolichol-phosphate mannosyltransferase